MERTIYQIDEFLGRIGEYWQEYSDLSFGQILDGLMNVSDRKRIDLQEIEDDDLMNQVIEKYFDIEEIM